ncbi:NAD(P)-binding domain protein [Moelleriella libera RCEF 2490]|uniref:NAD(P)-binding domain protein n=1 Tax=Moelleriella libera RCEF 2490 TaxID=1081109 RepID=A0A167ZL45_9HYPO|nr:NAD(P)-binding domain protein [Moelleriella libera RCEF 2490]
MVALADVLASNAAVKTALPPAAAADSALVGVFVGATSGIGRTSLLHLARHTARPRLYFVGRSQRAADEMLRTLLREANPDGEYRFVRADVSLLREVDRTDEKLTLILALSYYSRMRFIANLLPQLRRAPALRRVVSVMAGTKEGPLDPRDIPGRHVRPWRARGHLCTMTTLTLEDFARQAPAVSFVHSYPGFVDTPLAGSMRGVVGALMRAVFFVTGLVRPHSYIEECGERHVYLATGARFPPRTAAPGTTTTAAAAAAADDGDGDGDVGVKELAQGSAVEATAAAPAPALGTDGVAGSGVYSVDELCEPADAAVRAFLQAQRDAGLGRAIAEHLQQVFTRVSQ